MELNIESLISDLAFILILGAVTTLLFKWLRQPVVLGYIVAGFLASPHFTYLPSVTTESNIEFWAQIGIVILLFSLGLEFSFKKLLNAGGSAVITALIIVTGMLAVGFAIGHLMGFNNINSLFLGGMLSMSSTTIIIKAFTDMNLRQKKFASLVLAVLIVEDLFAVVMMVLLSSIAINNSVEGGQMLFSIMKLVFFLVMWFLVGVFVLPSLLNTCRRYLNDETLLIVSMGLCLGMAVFSVYCGFSLALGAFVMGSILAGTSFAERIEHVTTPVKDLFGSVFFISVGMMVNPDVIAEFWGPILLLSIVVIVGMILFGTSGMLLTGQTLKIAIQSGFSLTQIGEFAFIIATLGMSLGVLNTDIYPIVVAVSVLTTFTTPYFIRLANPFYDIIERHLPQKFRFLIDRYSETAQAESETKELWKTVFQRYVWRILLYGILLTALMLVGLRWLIPFMHTLLPKWGTLLGVLCTLALMSPFLLALSLPASKKTERKRLLSANARFDLPLHVMTAVRLLLALGFMVYLLTAVYSLTVGWTLGLAGFVLLILLFSKRVSKRMKMFETRFIDNLNEKDLRRTGRNNNLVSNMHLAFVKVGYDSPLLGEQLGQSQLRKNYGVNIASIQRGNETIMVPGPDSRLFPGDILGIIGTEEEIQTVIPILEQQDNAKESVSTDDIQLKSVQLSDQSPILGMTTASADLRGKYQALLVNLQRGDEYLTPDATTPFKAHDILWLVGNIRKIGQLR